MRIVEWEKGVHRSVSRKVLEVIRRVILEEAEKLGVSVERIVLFGSRARGDYREDSDYDILVVVRNKLSRKVKIDLSVNISSRLIDEIHAPVDVIVVSETSWRKYRSAPGTVLYSAGKEGVLVA